MSTNSAIISSGDLGYPRRLCDLASAPRQLYVRGKLPGGEHSIAIVGARAAPMTAVAQTRELACDLARAGAAIISGGALGIDAAAHRGALAAAGRPGAGATAAVFGCGIDVVYPLRHRALFGEIVAAGGALVSEFAPDAPPRAGHFVRRNQTIAGLADAVLVAHAGLRSGSLHTARAALKLGRLVAAVPGSPGCERLIAQGAAVVRCADDLWSALAGSPQREAKALPAPDSSAARVLALLHHQHSQTSQELATRASLGARDVARALVRLELDGLAIAMPGQCYVRSALADELLAPVR